MKIHILTEAEVKILIEAELNRRSIQFNREMEKMRERIVELEKMQTWKKQKEINSHEASS
jgi:hypothetical protein